MKTKKTIRLNIYLTGLDRKKMMQTKEKYHLSWSTIANILAEHTFMAMARKGIDIRNHYLYEDNNSMKTSIKPRNEYNYTAMTYTNAVKLFTRDDYKKYLEQEEANKLKSKIYNLFQNTYDENWNGNQLSRFIPKFFKQNKTYSKKLLGIEDD